MRLVGYLDLLFFDWVSTVDASWRGCMCEG